jgi:hypothetical protein
LRDAFTWAVSDPATADACGALCIDGFVSLGHDEYATTLQLVDV